MLFDEMRQATAMQDSFQAGMPMAASLSDQRHNLADNLLAA